jgi:hypothetical protein
MKKIILVALVTLGIAFGSTGLVSAAPTATACDPKSDNTCVQTTPFDQCADETNCNIVVKYLNPAIKLLTIFVGIAVVIGITVGGIQYAASGGDPSKAAAAKLHIRNSIIALLCYFFLYAFLQFAIPGGGLTTG